PARRGNTALHPATGCPTRCSTAAEAAVPPCWRRVKRVALALSMIGKVGTGFPRKIMLQQRVRGIAQPGSAAVLGTAGRWFESSCPDQLNQQLIRQFER